MRSFAPSTPSCCRTLQSPPIPPLLAVVRLQSPSVPPLGRKAKVSPSYYSFSISPARPSPSQLFILTAPPPRDAALSHRKGRAKATAAASLQTPSSLLLPHHPQPFTPLSPRQGRSEDKVRAKSATRPANRNLSQRRSSSTAPLEPDHSCYALLAPCTMP